LRALLTVTGGGFQVGYASGLVVVGGMSKLGVNVCIAYWNLEFGYLEVCGSGITSGG